MLLPKSTLLRLRLKAIREVKLTVDGREFHALITRSVNNFLRRLLEQ